MTWLFEQTVDKDSWGVLFRSIDAFEPLIRAIFERHDLVFTGIENLTPGSNAVFRVGDRVVKIFAPVESGLYNNDFEIETEAQKHANNQRVSSPKLLYAGFIRDKYLFEYIIMEFISGQEAEQELLHLSEEQRKNFALQLRQITDKLNVATTSGIIPKLTVRDCFENNRWEDFSKSFCDNRKSIIKELSFDSCTYTHGDLTAENMIIGDGDTVYIIDFADSRIAPSYYEWPPIVFGLFGCNPTMMTAYFGDYHNDNFYEQLTLSILVHEFGAVFIRQLCELENEALNTLTDVLCLKTFIISCLKKGNAKVK